MRGQPKNTPPTLVRVEYDYRGERRTSEPLMPYEAKRIYIRLMKQERNPVIKKDSESHA